MDLVARLRRRPDASAAIPSELLTLVHVEIESRDAGLRSGLRFAIKRDRERKRVGAWVAERVGDERSVAAGADVGRQ
jgi:hypothetical protein